MKFETFRWLFPVAIIVHNLEEAIWLPGWSQDVGKWHPPVGRYEFWFAVAVLTALVYVLMALSIRNGKQSLATYLFVGYAFAMLLNVIMPHLLSSLFLHRYSPGLATALIINLPITALTWRLAMRDGFVSEKRCLLVSPGVSVVLLASVPGLFFLGRHLLGPSG